MPPQAGIFTQPLHPSTLPPDSARQKSLNPRPPVYQSPIAPTRDYHYSHTASSYVRPQPGPADASGSMPVLDESKKDKRRRETADRIARIAEAKRDERAFLDQQALLRGSAHQLYTNPNSHAEFSLKLYPITLERTANVNRIEAAEQAGVHRGRADPVVVTVLIPDTAEAAYDEEQEKIEEEWKRQRDRLRERMLEAIEERRRKAREEKDGEGAGESILDPQSRPHATRNSRHGQGISTPTLSEQNGAVSLINGPLGGGPTGPTTAGMALYPWALSGPPVPEDLSSPFPLPLTSLAPPNAYAVNTKGKRVKDNKSAGAIDLSVSKALAPARTGWTGGWGTGTTSQSNGGGPDVGAACLKLMGRAVTMLAPAKDNEIEADLNEIRQGMKRRRTAAPGAPSNR
ncbi:Centrosomal protein ATPase [Ceratobasidium theobromae]|uniref:Centrosomal protein ATPase n=1 Tax=Ceratobasidium theobromae TaxID=1582974 RepID=A0A5N5QSA0_9AGAM|nr:Centrosomal protein ATPase [Ceratobasidium theobromae]